MNDQDKGTQEFEPSHNKVFEKLEQIHADIKVIKSRSNMLDGEPMLSFDEVCHVLNMSERQVRRFREEKKLVGFLVGRRRMYMNSEVLKFIEMIKKEEKKIDKK